MGAEERPEKQAASYRDRIIIEVEGYIRLFSDSNIFADRLDKLGIKEDALESYRQELGDLNALSAETDDDEARAIHDSYEEQRIQLASLNS